LISINQELGTVASSPAGSTAAAANSVSAISAATAAPTSSLYGT
jgi:hypothetical protein